MKLIRLNIVLILILFFTIVATRAGSPEWTVNPASFDMSANMIARLYVNYDLNSDPDNIVGAFVGTECRGIAYPSNVMNSWIYFLTLYSDTINQTISFKVYLADRDTVLDLENTVVFQPDAVYGSVGSPEELTGFIDYDFSPLVRGIPDQVIETGNAFAGFDLDNYLTLYDTDAVSWGYQGNRELVVSINSDNVITIGLPSPDWTGNDTVIFTVTDLTENGYSSSDTVQFRVLTIDHWVC